MTYLFNSTLSPLRLPQIRNAQGCFIYDQAGHQYLDLESGVWALPLGHNHPNIRQALLNQLPVAQHVGYQYNHSVAEEAAQKLIEIAQFEQGQCVFLSSGSEAVEYAVRITKTLNPNKHCLSLDGQYLAAYGLASNQNEQLFRLPWSTNENKSTTAWKQDIAEQLPLETIGSILIEPGNSGGSVRFPPENLVRALQKIADAYQIPMIVDEVTTGIGRTGKWFGFMHYPLQPDIIAVGKGLGNGYPISAVILAQPILQQLEQFPFVYAQSHQNDPLGCRVALAVIETIEQEQLLTHVQTMNHYFNQQFQKLQQQYPILTETRNRGCLTVIQFNPQLCTIALINQLEQKLFEKGILVGLKANEGILRLYMPLITTSDMLDCFFETLQISLDEVLVDNDY